MAKKKAKKKSKKKTASRPAKGTAGKLTVFIADDEVLFRDVLKDRLAIEKDFLIVGETGDGAEAVKMVKRLRPNVVLMDINIPTLNGIDATKAIRAALPAAKILMVSAYTDELHVMQAVQAGAYGYISKKLPTQELVNALKAFADHGTMLPQPVMQRAVSRLSKAHQLYGTPLGDLTQTQMHVLSLLGEGKSNKEVAEVLGCNVKTVKNHLNTLFQKFDVKNRTEAVIKGIKAGLISAH
jgi:two-component system response regulator DegU